MQDPAARERRHDFATSFAEGYEGQEGYGI
ncbi:MAG: hypothetical protein RLZ97_406 [Verrucomicrobiota bacterium]|jgi:hypothetical protein